MTFNVLNQFKAYNETTITGRHRSSNVVAPQCVCRCGLRIAFVAFECRRMSSLCSARAAVGCVLPSQYRMSWIRSAYAAVGCALPLSHPRAPERRCPAVCTPLWAAHCLRCIQMPTNFVAPERRISSAMRPPLWAAHCLRRIRMPMHLANMTTNKWRWYFFRQLFVGMSACVVNRKSRRNQSFHEESMK